ncbi:unnamed protein product [Urochloa humidicola]
MGGYQQLLRSGGEEGSAPPPPVRVPHRQASRTLGFDSPPNVQAEGGCLGHRHPPRPPRRSGCGSSSRSRSRGGGRPAAAAQPVVADKFGNVDEDLDQEFPTENDRVIWTNENTHKLCEAYCIQIYNGECQRGAMSRRGWKDVQRRYYAATGLMHDTEQFGSRHRQLKKLWFFIQRCRNDTGLGRNANGTILASNEWWDANTAGHPEWKRLKDGWPSYMEELDTMFLGVMVTGGTSFDPGQQHRRNNTSSYDDEYDDDDQATPNSIGSKMTSSGHSTRSTCSSSHKRTRNPAVLAVANNLKDCNLIQEDKNQMMASWMSHRQREKAQREKKLKEVQRLARECGATETSGNLWVGVLAVCRDETYMDFFIGSEPAGRLRIVQTLTDAITGVKN